MPANPDQGRRSWWAHFRTTAAFVEQHGRLPKQREVHRVDDGPDLRVGRWLMHQRGTSDPEQAEALSTLLAGRPATRDEAWEQRRRQVVDYATHHDDRVPGKGTVWHDAPVGQWVRDQRKAYGRVDLSADRVAACEKIPGWQWAPEEDNFQTGLAHFVAYRDRYGTGGYRSTTSTLTARSAPGPATGAATATPSRRHGAGS